MGIAVLDPHLNSVHLELPRREEFRRARQCLLDARGANTIRIEAGCVNPHRPATIGDTLADQAAKSGSPAVAVASPFVLVCRDRVYPLKIGMNIIGRLPDNDVVVEDPHVSRRHCAILVHTTQVCELHDIASKNGTCVNGRRITSPTRLHPGDEIQMCDFRVILKRADDQPEPDPPFKATL